ncbi:MAG: circularly permuted type 2 ATP-grasp protein, partial [Nitrospiraceae bacterium]|nr:circularly permuted type 2 ATP-grasp protein [Nitrospiraceae bacterium]
MQKTEPKQNHPSPTVFDEMFFPEKTPRPSYEVFKEWMDKIDLSTLGHKQAEAEALFKRLGITFSLYGAEQSGERQIPFDIIPRIFSRSEWRLLANGSCQRIRAINAFLNDIYHEKEIIRAGIIPESQVLRNPLYRKELENVTPPGGVYVHIAGVDIVRVSEEVFYVLEDNLRTPSGASYMLENRSMMMRLFPEVFDLMNIAPVDHYPQTLLHTLQDLVRSKDDRESPCTVLLTPGVYNSAYFEHAFLAEQMGVELVEGQDLFVQNDKVYMRTTQGSQRVDIIYRRIDDDFLDPKAFRKDSLIGVPGLADAYRAGNVLLANALGTGVADDKSTYTYVPEMISFYLGEKPLLKNVDTYCLSKKDDLQYVL